MQIITLKDGTDIPIANYNDGDIFISKDFLTMQYDHEPFKTAMTMIVLCIEGSGTVTLNDKKCNFAADDMIIVAPNTIVCDGSTTQGTKFRILAFEGKNLRNTMVLSQNIWKNANFIKANPVCKLSDYQYKVMNHYFELADLYCQNAQDIYQKEKMTNLIRCWIYDLLTMISEHSDYADANKEMISSGDIMLQRFIEILSLHNGKMRFVQKAAQQMCVSPKYLSAVIKQTSGRTAQSIIHEFTINAIKEQLRYSGKTIKEISNDMEFPEVSFFGKFFKQHMKMTPLQYRRQVLDQKEEQTEDPSPSNAATIQQTTYSKEAKLNKKISSFYSTLGLLSLF